MVKSALVKGPHRGCMRPKAARGFEKGCNPLHVLAKKNLKRPFFPLFQHSVVDFGKDIGFGEDRLI